MKRLRGMLLAVTTLICLPGSLFASEMFSEYPKRFAIGYDTSPLIRYWFSDTWGIDIRPDYRINKDTSDNSLPGTVMTSYRETGTYFLQIDGVYQVKSFSFADYNLLLGVSYEEGYSRITDTFYGPSVFVNNSSSRLHEWRILFGPEIEIKVPYFSRFRISASILANYALLKNRYASSSPMSYSVKSTRFSIDSNGNSLDGLMHVGLRYYF
jgi:hypothetical protein